MGENGTDAGLWLISTVTFTLVIQVITLKLLLISTHITWVSIIACASSVAFYYFTLYVISLQEIAFEFQSELVNTLDDIMSSSKIWSILLMVPLIALIPDFIAKVYTHCFNHLPLITKASTKEDDDNSILQNFPPSKRETPPSYKRNITFDKVVPSHLHM